MRAKMGRKFPFLGGCIGDVCMPAFFLSHTHTRESSSWSWQPRFSLGWLLLVKNKFPSSSSGPLFPLGWIDTRNSYSTDRANQQNPKNGGALYADNSNTGGTSFIRSTFRGNSAPSGTGGAVYLYTLGPNHQVGGNEGSGNSAKPKSCPEIYNH